MPIYECHCSGCGHDTEVFQKISEPEQARCPACGENTLRRLVSAGSFILKGGGWYVTDFKDKAKADAKADAKVDDKSAASAPSKDKSGEAPDSPAPKKDATSSAIPGEAKPGQPATQGASGAVDTD